MYPKSTLHQRWFCLHASKTSPLYLHEALHNIYSLSKQLITDWYLASNYRFTVSAYKNSLTNMLWLYRIEPCRLSHIENCHLLRYWRCFSTHVGVNLIQWWSIYCLLQSYSKLQMCLLALIPHMLPCHFLDFAWGESVALLPSRLTNSSFLEEWMVILPSSSSMRVVRHVVTTRSLCRLHQNHRVKTSIFIILNIAFAFVRRWVYRHVQSLDLDVR